MKKKNKIWVLVLSICLLGIFYFIIQGEEGITYKIIQEDQEIVQKDFVSNEEKGLVGYFVMPQTLVENENVKIRITKITPKENFQAKLEVVVENNLEENISLYSQIRVDDGSFSEAETIEYEIPVYKENVIQEIYRNDEKIDEKMVPNPETYEEFYFRKREYFTESMNYKYKQVFEVEICYAEKCMEPKELELNLQVFYTSKIAQMIRVERLVNLFTNDEIEAQKEIKEPLPIVTSFLDVNLEVAEIEKKQYILERNMLILYDKETEKEEVVYQPQKRGHYILRFFVGEFAIYFIEEIPAEEVTDPNIYKKYFRLCKMNRDGTDAETILDDMECDWFYIPAIYLYEDVLYLYDWDFLKEYRLDEYGNPVSVLLEKDSIYSAGFSDSLLILDTETEENDFYGLPFWLKKYGYRIVASDSGEVMVDKNGEWETLLYFNETMDTYVGFYATNLEAIANGYLVFRVEETGKEKAYVYNLEKEMVETILTLPNGDTNCKAIYADDGGIYFQKRTETASDNLQIYYYQFATKKVIISEK
jgi:hypothetical protein